MLSLFASQPLYAPLLPLLERLPDNGEAPPLEFLNALADERAIVSGGGASLRFVVPGGSGLSYEERVWWLGEVETRPGNWHDAFNALVWLSFPCSKAAINRCHHRADTLDAPRPTSAGRGPLRDVLTHFDECGVVLASPHLDVWRDICAHRWEEVFWTRRGEFGRRLKVFVFGHASYDLLRQPYIGLCGKALFLHVDDAWLTRPLAAQRADIDARLALRLGGALPGRGGLEKLRPLPLLGIPGATPDNTSSAYYRDIRQFRPLRLVRGA